MPHEDVAEAVAELRTALARVCEHAASAAGHYHDWERLGVLDHHPPAVTLMRVQSSSDAMWQLAEAALDARLAAGCLRSLVYGRDFSPMEDEAPEEETA